VSLMNRIIFTNMINVLLLVGIVDQINDNSAVIEYEKNGKLVYSTVSLVQSACTPSEGMVVHFFKDYKIVKCEDNL